MESKCYCGHTTTCDCGPLETKIEWIDIKQEQPTKEGKYIVKTKTMMGNKYKIEYKCTIKDDKAHFSVTNQIVTHWLKEN